MNNIKLFLIGIAIGVIMFLIAACASAPIFCPK
jgi:gas vesicle protein